MPIILIAKKHKGALVRHILIIEGEKTPVHDVVYVIQRSGKDKRGDKKDLTRGMTYAAERIIEGSLCPKRKRRINIGYPIAALIGAFVFWCLTRFI